MQGSHCINLLTASSPLFVFHLFVVFSQDFLWVRFLLSFDLLAFSLSGREEADICISDGTLQHSGGGGFLFSSVRRARKGPPSTVSHPACFAPTGALSEARVSSGSPAYLWLLAVICSKVQFGFPYGPFEFPRMLPHSLASRLSFLLRFFSVSLTRPLRNFAHPQFKEVGLVPKTIFKKMMTGKNLFQGSIVPIIKLSLHDQHGCLFKKKVSCHS